MHCFWVCFTFVFCRRIVSVHICFSKSWEEIRPYLQGNHYHHITQRQQSADFLVNFPPRYLSLSVEMVDKKKGKNDEWFSWCAYSIENQYGALYQCLCDTLYAIALYFFVCLSCHNAAEYLNFQAVVYHKLCIFSVGNSICCCLSYVAPFKSRNSFMDSHSYCLF